MSVRTRREKHTADHPSASEFDYAQNLLDRDRQYVDLLRHFVKNQKRTDMAQLIFKSVFFALVCVVFFGVVAAGCLAIYNISRKSVVSWQDFGTALAGLGSILGVIIVLPSKIAEHLFPSGGNKESMDLVKSMQEYDLVKQPQEDTFPDEYMVDVTNIPSEDHTSVSN